MVNKEMLKVFMGVGLLASVGSVQAEDSGLGIGVGVRASTLGAGVELGKSFSDYFSVRLGLNKHSMSDNQNIDGIDYDADLDLQSTSLLLDWNPFGSSFHLTAGYLNSSNELVAHAAPKAGTTLDVGGQSYTTTADNEVELDGSIKLGSGPYLGLGWGSVPAKGFGFTFEAGVVQMGTPDVSLKFTDNVPGGTGITQADVDQEEKNMQDDLSEFELYPVVSLGISYGF